MAEADLSMTELSGLDRRGLERAYRDHAPAVYRLLERRSGSKEVAQDLAAIVFEQAAHRFLVGRGEEVTGAWLSTVAQRRLVDHWRREGRRRSVVAEIHRSAVDEVEELLIGGSRLVELLEPLPRRDRSILLMRYVVGLPVGVVARELGLSYAATESATRRARECARRVWQASGLVMSGDVQRPNGATDSGSLVR